MVGCCVGCGAICGCSTCIAGVAGCAGCATGCAGVGALEGEEKLNSSINVSDAQYIEGALKGTEYNKKPESTQAK